jgi:hypothetical protein
VEVSPLARRGAACDGPGARGNGNSCCCCCCWAPPPRRGSTADSADGEDEADEDGDEEEDGPPRPKKRRLGLSGLGGVCGGVGSGRGFFKSAGISCCCCWGTVGSGLLEDTGSGRESCEL